MTIVAPRAWRRINTHATKGGTALGALVELVDIYPSLLELVGLRSENLHPLEGSSFARLLSNTTLAEEFPESSEQTGALSIPWKRAVFSQVSRRGRPDPQKGSITTGFSMRTPRYRLTLWVRSDTHRVTHFAKSTVEADTTRDVLAAAERRQRVNSLRSLTIQSMISTSLNRHRPRAVELYDLLNDPYEDINVAADLAYADVTKRLLRLWLDGFCGEEGEKQKSYAAAPPVCAISRIEIV